MQWPDTRSSAVDQDGKSVSGVSRPRHRSARRTSPCSQRGLQPIDVEEKKSVLQFEVTKKKVTRKEVMHFSRQLGVFVKAGIPILDALEIIDERDVRQAFQAGPARHDRRGFVRATPSPPPPRPILRPFPATTSAVLDPPSSPGTLDKVLDELAEYIERDIDARSQVTSALVYPRSSRHVHRDRPRPLPSSCCPDSRPSSSRSMRNFRLPTG